MLRLEAPASVSVKLKDENSPVDIILYSKQNSDISVCQSSSCKYGFDVTALKNDVKILAVKPDNSDADSDFFNGNFFFKKLLIIDTRKAILRQIHFNSRFSL